jgi:CHAT domain-containing protein
LGLLLIALGLNAQSEKKGIPQLDSLILQSKFQQAQGELNAQLEEHFSKKQLDSLGRYAYYVGRIQSEIRGANRGRELMKQFIQKVHALNPSHSAAYNSLLSASEYYDEVGDVNRSLEVTREALVLISKDKKANPEEKGKVKYNLGVTHLSMGSVDSSKVYVQASLKDYLSYSPSSAKNLSDAYNALGAISWMSSRLDSAKYYYDSGIRSLRQGDPENLSNAFQIATIRSNISLLEYTEGNLAKALKIQERVIADYQKVIDQALNTEMRENAKRNQLIAIYNLSAFYNEIGNFSKSLEIIEMSYRKAESILDPDDPELIEYLISIGQAELALQNFEEALVFLNKGLNAYEDLKIENPFWQGIGHYAKAKTYMQLKDETKALANFNQAESLFERAMGNQYGSDHLALLRDKSVLLAGQGQKEAAISTAKKGYDYLLSKAESNRLQQYKSIANLSEVYSILQDYGNSIRWARKGVSQIEEQLNTNQNDLDNIQLNYYKPSLIYYWVDSAMKLDSEIGKDSIRQSLKLLGEATDLLELRKVYTNSVEDIALINSQYKTINNLQMRLHLRLLEEEGESASLSDLISLKESSVYNGIRLKMNLRDIKFRDLPDAVLEREKELRSQLKKVTEGEASDMGAFFQANAKWALFLEELKSSHPKYYEMRYARLQEPVERLKERIPPENTLVRYLFIEERLYALVATSEHMDLVPLNRGEVNIAEMTLSPSSQDEKALLSQLSKLYTLLWEPLEDLVTTKEVIIFPDQNLFNLSFELLPFEPCNSYADLAKNSLLAKHSISYNFSLSLYNRQYEAVPLADDFIAFAPGFDRTMKNRYRERMTDSLFLDQAYMRLLPQPFISSLIQKMGDRLGSDYFIKEAASKKSFLQQAGGHRLLHIGTHAESNNVSPELSRLIFAKDLKSGAEVNDNSLFAYEIYNQDLRTNLAILSACETGKPTHQAGEGMISLAHAFNYAGSQSILTSLWQIDEQASAEILEDFYEYLMQGKTKGEALRLAKLDYLEEANGRRLHPQYWAGLIILGDNAPVSLNPASPPLWAWALSLLLIAGILLVVWKRKTRRS